MGTPSGSKNCSVYTDRLDQKNLRDFEVGAIDSRGIVSDAFSDEPLERAAEKRLKANEMQEWRSAKSVNRISQKLARRERILPKAPEGPTAVEKKSLPSHMKLKMKETAQTTTDEPRCEMPSAGTACGVSEVRSGTVSPPETSTLGGLVSYGSEDSEDGDE